jgi:hypothetical protein
VGWGGYNELGRGRLKKRGGPRAGAPHVDALQGVRALGP